MKALTLPSSGGWVVKFSYGFLEGGFWSGVPGFVLELSGKPFGSVATQGETARPEKFLKGFLEAFLSVPRMENVVLRVKGMFLPQDTMLGTLLRALKPYNVSVHVLLNEQNCFADTAQYANWVIFETANPELLLPANEVWFSPWEEAELASFQAPPQSGALVRYYLNPGRRAEDEVLEYLSKRHGVWGLLK